MSTCASARLPSTRILAVCTPHLPTSEMTGWDSRAASCRLRVPFLANPEVILSMAQCPRNQTTPDLQPKLLAAEGVVLEALFAHALRGVEISSVDHQFARHHVSGAVPIQLAERIPLGANQRGIGVL